MKIDTVHDTVLVMADDGEPWCVACRDSDVVSIDSVRLSGMSLQIAMLVRSERQVAVKNELYRINR